MSFKSWTRRTNRLAAGLVGLAVAPVAWGQTAVHSTPFAANVIVPQARSFGLQPSSSIDITGVSAKVVILEQVATTTLEVSIRNPQPRATEAELLVPVPDGAVVRGLAFEGSASEPTAQLLPKDEARRLYESIVAKSRDPALLEFAGYNLVRTSVFPVAGNGSQKVRLTYEHLLAKDGARVDYVLPRSESLHYVVPWEVSLTIRAKRPIATVYSPSHALGLKRAGAGEVQVSFTTAAMHEPGPLRVSYLLEDKEVTASLMAYPDPKVGGGYFLMLAGLPAAATGADGSTIRREVTLVLDRSGSMNGEKITQAREAALQVLSGLDAGEAFRLICYSDGVELYSERAVIKTDATVAAARSYLQTVNARGGTNLHDALREALRPEPLEGFLPIVLFLTDGLPTVGQRSEAVIRDLAIQHNPHDRRVFTFGVGVDVNTPLLEKIASATRATPTFVLPGEDVEAKVGQAFARLKGPVLADATLTPIAADGSVALHRVRDLLPGRLPDLFEGDQLVVLGQYVGDAPLTFKVSGNYLGKSRNFRFTFDLASANPRNSFVPRLWASRKVAMLIDEVRQMGASPHLTGGPAPAAIAGDPRLKELVDEIVRISTEFGILTEYTAFLAREGTDLSDREQVLSQANEVLLERAVACRTGLASINQESNQVFMKGQVALNRRNGYVDANMNRVEVTTVQQVADRAFFRRNNRWVDSRMVEDADTLTPRRTIESGSEEFRELVARLAGEGRQGCVSLAGDVLMMVDGESVLVRSPMR